MKSSRAPQCLPNSLGRRLFLGSGFCALGGLTLPDLLALEAQGAAHRRDTSVILLWMTGGPSHVDTYDMKPLAPTEVRGPFSPIPTSLPGLELCELMPKQATLAHRLAVIRSLTHDFSVHDDAQHLVQTGYPQLDARRNGQRHPCQGSVTSLFRGPRIAGMPAYVCVPEDYRRHMGFYQTAAFLPARHNALNSGGDPADRGYRPPDFEPPHDVTATRVDERRSLLVGLDARYRAAPAESEMAALSDVQRQAFELVRGSAARRAFDLSTEPASVQALYGAHPWGRYTLLARRLVEAGVRFVTVNLYEKDVDWWDDHSDIERNLRKRLPIYDRLIHALLTDLSERGLSEQVLVVACGEFGRAPRIDTQAGRGHWPKAMHAVLSGGGIREGQVVGATTRDVGEPAERPLSPGDLLATIYQVLGIDPQATVRDRLNRPIPLLAGGTPIRELI